MEKRVMIVLGGNAFVAPGQSLTMARQFQFAREALEPLRPLLASDSQVVITHGNGPQVGHMLTRVEEALGKAYAIPLEVCVAESEGELGYVIQQTLYNLLQDAGHQRPIASLLTQVLVDSQDPAFGQPTKPIGPFYSAEQAAALREKDFAIREDAGRGFRRVVPSPQPQEILEVDVIRRLLDDDVIVIAAGGGGIPVVRQNGKLCGIEAVIDKDHASALLGEAIQAERMVILTAVPCAYRNFQQPSQSPIGMVSVSEAEQLLAAGHFAPGSMQPKMQAAIRFVKNTGSEAIICDSTTLPEALKRNAGTIIQANR